MSAAIEVSGLTKFYGPVRAVDGLSFSVDRGEVVGILGPNGAGKSTTIRILTGFLPASSGLARVAGHDVARESRAARRQIGYLPENVPLYPEMRVDEYLYYRAALKDVPRRDRRARVDEAVQRCWLGEMRRRLIGRLSKGFRQRVGLADALLAKPPILILDEPTVGLDPNQIRQVRGLIQELGKDHTILLSTHILPEVEAVCSRVVIIHRGRLAFAESLARLAEAAAKSRVVRIEAVEAPGVVVAALRGVSGIASIAPAPDGRSVLATSDAGDDPRAEVFRACVAGRLTLRELRREAETLEDIFARVTIGADAASARAAGDAVPRAAGAAS